MASFASPTASSRSSRRPSRAPPPMPPTSPPSAARPAADATIPETPPPPSQPAPAEPEAVTGGSGCEPSEPSAEPAKKGPQSLAELLSKGPSRPAPSPTPQPQPDPAPSRTSRRRRPSRVPPSPQSSSRVEHPTAWNEDFVEAESLGTGRGGLSGAGTVDPREQQVQWASGLREAQANAAATSKAKPTRSPATASPRRSSLAQSLAAKATPPARRRGSTTPNDQVVRNSPQQAASPEADEIGRAVVSNPEVILRRKSAFAMAEEVNTKTDNLFKNRIRSRRPSKLG